MRRFLVGLSRTIFWTYRRGSWQYDILCAVILAFIFLTPKSVFDGTYFSQRQEQQELEGEKDREKQAHLSLDPFRRD